MRDVELIRHEIPFYFSGFRALQENFSKVQHNIKKYMESEKKLQPKCSQTNLHHLLYSMTVTTNSESMNKLFALDLINTNHIYNRLFSKTNYSVIH